MHFLLGPFHTFPNPESVIVEHIERFNDWKAVLDLDIQKIGDRKIYNNVRLCGNHFEDCFKLPSGRLTQNSRPTLFCSKLWYILHISVLVKCLNQYLSFFY